MNSLRDIPRLPVFLALIFSLGACAPGVPGSVGGGGALPGGIPPGSVTLPSGGGGEGQLASATGEEKAKGDNGGGVPEGSDDAAPAPASGPMPISKPDGFTLSLAQKPLPGGLPAPTHEFPHMYAGINGSSSVCRTSDDKVFLHVEGFVGKEDYPGAPFVNYDNIYTLSVFDKVSHQVLFKTPLASKTLHDPMSKNVHDPKADVVRTGYVDVMISFPPDEKYPDCLEHLDFYLTQNPNPVREYEVSESEISLRGEKKIPVAGVIFQLGGYKKLPDCPLMKAPMESEGAEKAVALPEAPKN